MHIVKVIDFQDKELSGRVIVHKPFRHGEELKHRLKELSTYPTYDWDDVFEIVKSVLIKHGYEYWVPTESNIYF